MLYLIWKTQRLSKEREKWQRVKHLVRLSPRPGPIWGFLPSSHITFNIYKPLKRINQEGLGRALLPITSVRPPGFVTVGLIDLGGTRGVQSCCFGTRPLSKLGGVEKARGPGPSLDNTLRKHCDVCASPLLRPQPPHLFQELRGSVSQACADNCGVGSYTMCAVCHCCPPRLPTDTDSASL